MIKATVRINNKLGLHARASAKLSKLAGTNDRHKEYQYCLPYLGKLFPHWTPALSQDPPAAQSGKAGSDSNSQGGSAGSNQNGGSGAQQRPWHAARRVEFT